MAKFTDALKAGVRAMRDDRGPKRYAIAGRALRCPHCGQERFAARELLLETRGATVVGLEWLNDGAVALTCAECSAIQWFAARPQALEG
jgi:hypothetical protein